MVEIVIAGDKPIRRMPIDAAAHRIGGNFFLAHHRAVGRIGCVADAGGKIGFAESLRVGRYLENRAVGGVAVLRMRGGLIEGIAERGKTHRR